MVNSIQLSFLYVAASLLLGFKQLNDRLSSGERHAVTYPDGSRGFDHGVYACAGGLTGCADSNSVVPTERPEDIDVFGKFVLGECRHHAARIRQGHVDSHCITNRELATDPIVLDESSFLGPDDNVHPEPALVKAALGPKFIQLVESGRGQHGQREQIEERTDGNGGGKAGLGEEGRAELLFDDRISISCWFEFLDVRMVHVDGEVFRCGPRQSDISSEVG